MSKQRRLDKGIVLLYSVNLVARWSKVDTYTDDTAILNVLLDLLCVVKVGERADVVHVFGDGCGRRSQKGGRERRGVGYEI
jgi:hypothetical protein